MNIVLIGLGSNQGDRLRYLRNATKRLSTLPFITPLKTSFIYETPPFEVINQPHYLNAVLSATCSTDPHNLLLSILSVEKELGRVRTSTKNPRRIDLDLLLFGDQKISSRILTLPHPEFYRRKFVLIPACDIVPNQIHPIFQKSLQKLLINCSEDEEIIPTGLSLEKYWQES